MDDRTRVWTFCIYPDSQPDNWLELLQETRALGAVSPLHDKDINADGTRKKPHRHVILTFEGKKSYVQIKRISDLVNGCFPVKVESTQGLIRYFAHLDNPEKAQYSKEDIITLNGFNIDKYFKPSISAVNEIMLQMQDFILDNGITEYADLFKYARDNEQWVYVLNMFNCNSIVRLITSVRNRYSNAKGK